jgi:hypothetical protein
MTRSNRDLEWWTDLLDVLRDPPSNNPYSQWSQDERDAWIRRCERERDEIIEEIERRKRGG